MAAPTDVTRQGTLVTTAASTWSMVIPTVAAGDFMLAFLRASSNQNIISGDLTTSWTQLMTPYAGDASDDVTEVWAKVAVGFEPSQSVGWSGSCKGASLVYKITGADTTLTNWVVGTPEAFTTANFNPANQTFGSTGDWLVCLTIGLDGETQTFASPTNYATATSANSGTGGAVASNCRIAATSRGVTGVSSEDPGAWTQGAPNAGGASIVIGVPAPIAHTSLLLPNRNQLAIRR